MGTNTSTNLLLCSRMELAQTFLKHLNRRNNRIKFTIEDGCLPFIHVTREGKKNRTLELQVYEIRTNTSHCINANFYQHLRLKRILNICVHRAKMISAKEYLKAELQHLKNTL
ncbi:hypothetical protein Trydic_g8055 [Trypoxylus dichotomus]